MQASEAERKTLRQSMVDHIPFASGQTACALIGKHYRESHVVRVPLEKTKEFRNLLPSGQPLWIDGCADGLHDLEARIPRPHRRNTWFDFIRGFKGFKEVADWGLHGSPNQQVVDDFAMNLLTSCAAEKPEWITVPQLPIVTDSGRNRINRALAKATGRWKAAHGKGMRLILPAIFTHQDQINKGRTPRIDLLLRCYQEAQADGIWVVDKSLEDDGGSKTLRNLRFPAIVELHQEIAEAFPSTAIKIGGPYWGLNLVLWARGLVNYPAIGIGSGYQYHISGGQTQTPGACLALGPLRRRVGVGLAFKRWLDQVVSGGIAASHPAYTSFAELQRNYSIISGPERSREQVARFYKAWFDEIANNPAAGRALVLFQDLSNAYALGRSLAPLPADEGTARRPEAIAEHLMLVCL